MERIIKELNTLKEKKQLREVPLIDSKNNKKILIKGQDYINFASNDYLGISTDFSLRDEFLSQNKSLMSSASARLLSGSCSEFKSLEEKLANLFNKDKALIFNTGYQCNLGIISTLCSKKDVIFSDKLNHASIIDGMKLAEGDFIRYKHLDYNDLEKQLKTYRENYSRAIIVSESVFSMDGDTANIDKLVELKNKYNCLLMIDEAHAFCACGDDLTGFCCNKDVDIITATMGKALGSFGAFCVSNKEIISYLTNKARSFIFSTSIPPINIAWSYWLLTEKIDLLYKRKTHLENLSKKARELLPSTISKSHIIPIIIGSNEKTIIISEKLRSEGYYIPAIRPPTVAEGTSRLRISLTSESDLKDFKKIIKICS